MKFSSCMYNGTKQEAFARAKASWLGSFFFEQIFPNQTLHQLVPVDLTDHAAGIVVVGDVGGVLGQQVAHDLIDGIVTFLRQGFIHTAENLSHIFIIVRNYKL